MTDRGRQESAQAHWLGVNVLEVHGLGASAWFTVDVDVAVVDSACFAVAAAAAGTERDVEVVMGVVVATVRSEGRVT